LQQPHLFESFLKYFYIKFLKNVSPLYTNQNGSNWLETQMDRISFTISIHGARDLPLDVDPDHLPFRLTHLLEIGEAHANPSCHGVFISSIPNGWFINNEATNIRSDLDSETQKINLRFDLHGSNLRMYTITQDVKAIHDREKIWCKLIDGNGEDTKGEVQISFQYKSAAPSTPNADKKRFLIEVKIRNMTGFLSQMDNLTEGSFVWLSYELLGIAVQTDRFSPFDEKNTFPSRQNTFEFYGTNDETRAILKSKNAILKIYIRTDRFILGSFNVKLGALFCSENSTDSTFQQERQDIIADLENFVNQGKPLKDCIISDGDNDTKLHLSVRLQIQSLGSDFHYVSAESRKIEASTEKPPASIFEVHHHTQVEEKPSMYDQIIIAAKRTEVDEKRKQWAIFRRREEEKFRKHLRKKEEDVRRFLEQQIKRNEEDHTSVLEACRREYFSLESRLKKALAGIETKEREMKRKMDELEGLHEKKLVDLDLKEKILRKETQHLIDSEVSKN
jgi:hypothetical protein